MLAGRQRLASAVLLDQEPRANQRSERFVDLVAAHMQAEGHGLAVAGDRAVGPLAGEQPEHRPERPAGLGQAVSNERMSYKNEVVSKG